MTRVVMVLQPAVHLLDLAGPAQTFGTAATLGRPYELVYVAATDVVTSAQGLPLVAGTDWPALDADDLVVVPGRRTVRFEDSPAVDPATLDRLRAHHARGGVVASVCSGADVLGRAGLLDGRRCTTHHDLQDELAARYPRARVVRDVLYIADGDVVTSAGIASGIDLSLYLVAQRHGPAFAARVARAMVVYARRNGHEPQASAMLRHRAHVDDVVHRVQDHLDAGFAEPQPLDRLARLAGVSERTLTRAFTRATGMTPLRYQQALRVEHAQRLLSQGSTTEAAARAVGLSDARMLRRLRAALAEPGRDVERMRA